MELHGLTRIRFGEDSLCVTFSRYFISQTIDIFTEILQKTTLLKTTVSVAVRLSSNIPQKGKKSIGYWLVTCSGMVFVAVVLGITIIYYYILVSICTVLEEVIKRTVR
jgi:hypothetical protein